MNEAEYLAQTVYRQLEGDRPIVLISLLGLKGSTPRHEGSKMAVAADGTAYGTIGGSLIEAAAVARAREALTERRSSVLEFDLNGADASAPGMIYVDEIGLYPQMPEG